MIATRPATSPLRLALALAAAALLAPGVARADATARIRAEIEAALPGDLRAVEVRVPSSLAGAGGAIAIDWSRPARPGWITLRVRAGERSGWVRTRLAALAATVVAARDLPAGHSMAEADVRVELRAASAGPVLAGVESVIGRALRQPVAAGAPIPAAALERAAPLPRGHQVNALVRRGRLSISAAGLLERPAPVGQTTTVRLRATGRIVHGRLVDSNTVIVEVSP